MSPAEFDALISHTRLGQKQKGDWGSGKALKAARLHLVDGLTVAAAARKVGVSATAVWVLLGKVPRETCPHCGQRLPLDHAKRSVSGSTK